MCFFTYVDYTTAVNPILYAFDSHCNVIGYNPSAPRNELESSSGYSFSSELPDYIVIQTGTELWKYQSQMSFWYNSTEFLPQTNAFQDPEQWTEIGISSYGALEYLWFRAAFCCGC
ncbi:hypothetical protein BDZ45DRAFT_736713 [Acephala macrosclerotiorum]|nr:hypothetical protein BDZ45DRAFT_736713 [Acephala macrosclerotiorum]